MISLLTGLKAKFLLIGTALLGLLAAIAKYYKEKADRLQDENKQLEAQIEYDDAVDEEDEEIEADTDERTRKIAEQLEAGEPLDILNDPNDY